LAFPFGSRLPQAPLLAVLALAGAACFGGPRSEVPVPVPSPLGAGGSAAAIELERDSAPVSRDNASAALKTAAAGTKARAAKPAAPKAPAAKRTAPADRGSAAHSASRVKVDSTALEFAVTARLAHEPLTRAIARRTRNPELAERAAWAVTREAGRLRMSPSLLAAVLLVENRQLDSSAVSSQGAIGLMQVMPIHAGSYGCESADLMNVDANICHGARILHLYMVRSRSVTAALKRYNGCVRGANTPRCYRYPVRVLAQAARLRRDILANAQAGDARVRM
jgi:soluble lytic murein transglycosylase-like protein